MRILAWLALFALQIGIFNCGAGIDVCPTGADTAAYSQNAPVDTDHSRDLATDDSHCLAHAAHAFLDIVHPADSIPGIAQEERAIRHVARPAPELSRAIEHPPKHLHG